MSFEFEIACDELHQKYTEIVRQHYTAYHIKTSLLVHHIMSARIRMQIPNQHQNLTGDINAFHSFSMLIYNQDIHPAKGMPSYIWTNSRGKGLAGRSSVVMQ